MVFSFELKMKDQKRLLHKCLLEDIPAFVICGTDICSVQAMEAYYQIAVEKGCNSNFLEDLKLAIEDFKAFLHIPEHTRSLSGSLLGYKTIP